jgi:hypothetical protein
MEIVKQDICGNWSLISSTESRNLLNLTGELMPKHHQCAHGPKHSSNMAEAAFGKRLRGQVPRTCCKASGSM